MKWLFFLAFVNSLFSAPFGNPSMPRILNKGFFIPPKYHFDVRAGYEGDFVFDGQMKDVDTYTQITNGGTLTFNIWDRVDLYGVFGASQISSQWRFFDLVGRVRNAKMETGHDFLWGVGGRAILFHHGNWDLGFGGRYSGLHNSVRWLTVDGSPAPLSDAFVRLHEWQINLGVSYHIDLLTPYIGVDYLNGQTELRGLSSWISDPGSRHEPFENAIPVGLYLGCSLSTGSYFVLNIEARVINQEAVSLSGDFRF